MAKQNMTVIIVILVIVIAGVMLLSNVQIKGKGMLEIRMYDKSGNLVGDSGAFSIVQGTPGVETIDVLITVDNTGDIELECNIDTVNPSLFSDAVTRSSKSIAAGSSATWASAQFPVASFEGTTTTLTASAICTYEFQGNTLIVGPQTGSTTIAVEAEEPTVQDPSPSFNVQVEVPGQQGNPTTQCGNNVCEVGEDSTSCSQDCSIVPSNRVKFRATSLDYSVGTAIAYERNCGTLVAYGYANTPGLSNSACDNRYSTGLDIIPGSGVGTWKIYSGNNEVWLCNDRPDGTSYSHNYKTSDPDASLVSTTSFSTDPSREVSC